MLTPDALAGLGPAVPHLDNERSAGRRRGGLFRPLAALLASTFIAVAAPVVADAETPSLTYEMVPGNASFPDAVEQGALRWACARSAGDLRRAFAAGRLPFDEALVHDRRSRTCHIDYAPTLMGFRAHPDDLPARELFINVDSLALVARRTKAFGDALDISARIVQQLERPISVVLSMERRVSAQWYMLGAAVQYGNRTSLVSWRTASTPNLSNPWTQDFLKSGVANRRARILVPRNLFEGRETDGALFAPFLDSFQRSDGFVRSRVSWEGGDLQFVRHPEDPAKLVLFHGQSAKRYWGEALTDDEFAYVLRREFGADMSVDVSHIVPHVDYFVSFLPADRVALVSEPITGNLEIASAAAELLEDHFGELAPDAVAELARSLREPEPLSNRRGDIRKLVAAARRDAEAGWPGGVIVHLYERIETYVHNHCRTEPGACFDDKGVDRMLRDDPELFRDWITESRRTRSDDLFTRRLLDIVESQVVAPSKSLLERIAAKVREIEDLGFRVVRVPRFGSDQNGSTVWAGISYVNSLLIDDLLYVPTFGLGVVESRMLDALADALPARYRIVPTYARHMLLHNGGVHCTVAIVRQPFDVDTRWMRRTDDD